MENEMSTFKIDVIRFKRTLSIITSTQGELHTLIGIRKDTKSDSYTTTPWIQIDVGNDVTDVMLLTR